MPLDEPGATAIVVLSREAEPVVGRNFSRHAEAGRDGMTPHVTLIAPFAPTDRLDDGVEDRLRRLLARIDAFDYRLERFASFPAVLYLAPEPSGPFVELIRALATAFPDYPPYDGRHDQVIPHLTVADTDDVELVEEITAEIEPRLPIECRAEEATLVVRGADRRWRPETSFPFGSLE